MFNTRNSLPALIVSFLIGAAVGALAVSLARSEPQEITVYPMLTIGNDRPYPVGIAVYRVDTQRQDVIYWRPGMVESPDRLFNCTIRDAANWHCETQVAGDRGVVTMERGHFEETVLATHLRMQGVTRELWERTRSEQNIH